MQADLEQRVQNRSNHPLEQTDTRRGLLSKLSIALGFVATTPLTACIPTLDDDDSAIGDDDDAVFTCEETQEDIMGPFHREDAPFRDDLNPNSLTGTPLYIEGRVFSEDCVTPLADAVVDVWHCTSAGDYDNESDEFELRGQVTTDRDGRYAYVTIQPGRYLNGNQYRPMHIHYRIAAADHEELVTQLYFEGDEFIPDDRWATPERSIPLSDDGEGGLVGTFDIVLACWPTAGAPTWGTSP
jgi:protocatechuate 3,4-dioxygenase beta subunit